MIYTLSLNPSLDYIVTVNDFQIGRTNRTAGELLLPGGKGINVSAVLAGLGVENTAIYFEAGFVGEEISRRLRTYGIRTEAIHLEEGCSRINLKIRNLEGTEINGRGPLIGESGMRQLTERLNRLKTGDVLVLAGSIPAGMPEALYGDLMQPLAGKGIRFVVDASGDTLRHTLQYHPFLVKPNRDELEGLFGKIPDGDSGIFQCAARLQELGAGNVLVSLGRDGAALLTEDGITFRRKAPEGTVINAVGAGDSMVAGFLAACMEGGDPERAFHFGIAAGSATAFSEGLAGKEEILRMLDRMDGRG